METKKIIIGFLLILIASAAVYITLDNYVRIRIDNDKSTFYVQENGIWVVSGVEYNKLFSGSKLCYRSTSGISVDTIIDNETNTVKITRIVPYKGECNGAQIIDTYLFEGNLKDKKNFPVYHTIELINATGLIFQYEIQRLEYAGRTITGVTSPLHFGKDMSVEWEKGYYYSRIYKYANKNEGKLTVKWKVGSDYLALKNRLFDPPTISTNITISFQGVNKSRFYELGSNATITVNISDGTNLLNLGFNVTINQTGYGINFTSGNGTLTFNLTTSANNDLFNDSTNKKNVSFIPYPNHDILGAINIQLRPGHFDWNGSNYAYVEPEVAPNIISILNSDFSTKSSFVAKTSLVKGVAWDDNANFIWVIGCSSSASCTEIDKYYPNGSYANFNITSTVNLVHRPLENVNDKLYSVDNTKVHVWNEDGTYWANFSHSSGTYVRSMDFYNSSQGSWMYLADVLDSDQTVEMYTFPNFTQMPATLKANCSTNPELMGILGLVNNGEILYVKCSTWKELLWGYSDCFDLTRNQTVFIRMNKYDDIWNASFDVQGILTNGTYPSEVKIYVNNTLDKSYSYEFKIGTFELNQLNNSNEIENVTFNISSLIRKYLKLPKNVIITNATFNLSGYNFTNTASVPDDTEDAAVCAGTYWTADYAWHEGDPYPCSQGYDELWYTTSAPDPYSYPQTVETWENYTYNGRWGDALSWTTKANSYFKVNTSAWNYLTSAWDVIGTAYSGSTWTDTWNINVTNSVSAGKPLQIKTTMFHINSVVLFYYEGQLEQYFREYPNNTYLEIGVPDGNEEWNRTIGEEFTQENDFIRNTTRATEAIQDYLDVCTADANGYCNVPLEFYSSTAGKIQISGINITYTFDPNPVELNVSLIKDYLNKFSSGEVDVPFRFSSATNGTLQIESINFSYYGSDNISVTANFPGDATYHASNDTKYIQVIYSGYNYTFPKNIFYLEFIPRTSNDKNVTPFGQTTSKPILNLTSLNYGRNMNLSIYLNQSKSCMNLSYSLTNSTTNLTWLQPNKWFNTWTNLSILSNKGIWLIADYNCSSSSWELYYPHLFIKGCCIDCVCAEEVK